MKLILNYCYLVALLSTISCTSNKTQEIYNKEDAFHSYETFSNRLHKSQRMSISQIATTIGEWKQLEDTVLHFIITDSVSDSSQNIEDIARCARTKNIITDKLVKLVDGQTRSYEDIIVIQQSLNEYSHLMASTEAFRYAEDFFKTVENNISKNTTVHQVLTRYINALTLWNTKDISSLKDIQEFIKEEDYLFVNFLNYLYQYNSEDVQAIIKATEKVTEHIYKSFVNKRLSIKELNIYMAIRTNRRLIQNAEQCAEAIRSRRITTPAQAAMTVSMLINPYSNYNYMCIGLRTKDQIAKLSSIGKQIEPLVSQLRRERLIDELKTDSLPYKLIKEYIHIKME